MKKHVNFAEDNYLALLDESIKRLMNKKEELVKEKLAKQLISTSNEIKQLIDSVKYISTNQYQVSLNEKKLFLSHTHDKTEILVQREINNSFGQFCMCDNEKQLINKSVVIDCMMHLKLKKTNYNQFLEFVVELLNDKKIAKLAAQTIAV